jgi:hypothetical protein
MFFSTLQILKIYLKQMMQTQPLQISLVLCIILICIKLFHNVFLDLFS